MYLQHQAQSEELPELLGFGIMFFLVGTLVQNFARRNRLQLEKTRQLNEQLLRNQQHLQDSLSRLESAEKSLRAKERLASLGELSAGIAHEIRNPLGIISSSAQLLEHEVSDPAAEQLLDIIQEESTRLNSLITDFLFFGRQLEPNLTDCDLGALISRDVDSLQSSAEHKGVSISFSNLCSPCLVQVDAAMIRQVLLNLLLNALDATDAGGNVTVTLREKDAQAQIMVADNGCGIPPEHREKVFDPFFTTKGGGTGLGLANSFKIIQSHGGELVLESAVGTGSCFTVQLPLKGGN
jgi:signal transduction histidine kinase